MSYLRYFFLLNLVLFSSFSLAEEEARISEHSNLKLEKPSSYPGVVKLISVYGKGQGTGFFITPDIIATANHVAKLGPFLLEDPHTGNYTFTETEVLEFDEIHDLALLTVMDYRSEHIYSVGSLETEEESDFRKITDYILSGTFHSDKIRERDPVTTIGFPLGAFNIVKGVVAHHIIFMFSVDVTHKTDEEITFFAGISGAPVFSEDDELVGVAVRSNYSGLPEQFTFVPVEILRELVRKMEGKNMMPSVKQEQDTIIPILTIKENKNFLKPYDLIPEPYNIIPHLQFEPGCRELFSQKKKLFLSIPNMEKLKFIDNPLITDLNLLPSKKDMIK